MTYEMDIAGLKRDLPLCKVSDDLYIGAFVMFGDVELTVHCAAELLKLTPEYDYLIAPEAKAIPLVYEMARQSGADKYFVARKKAKAYMSSVFQVHVKSITTQGVQTLVLDQTDAELIHGKRIVIVDDVMKFVLREQRRGRTYHGILMDPPSYGRGPNGEMWKIEDNLYPLVEECVKLLDGEARFFLINSYTTGLAPSVLSNVLKCSLGKRGGKIESDEVGLPITRGGMVLPCGASGRWEI